MKLLQRCAEKFPVQMRVYFCGCYAFVAQHFLHGPKVCTTLYQMRGKGMTECVRRNIFRYARFFYQCF